jgi:hypothetical protein
VFEGLLKYRDGFVLWACCPADDTAIEQAKQYCYTNNLTNEHVKIVNQEGCICVVRRWKQR